MLGLNSFLCQTAPYIELATRDFSSTNFARSEKRGSLPWVCPPNGFTDRICNICPFRSQVHRQAFDNAS